MAMSRSVVAPRNEIQRPPTVGVNRNLPSAARRDVPKAGMRKGKCGEHYDGRSERAFTSSLSPLTISMVLRISALSKVTPMVDAIEMSWAWSSR